MQEALRGAPLGEPPLQRIEAMRGVDHLLRELCSNNCRMEVQVHHKRDSRLDLLLPLTLVLAYSHPKGSVQQIFKAVEICPPKGAVP